jgi:hypothetical protein
VLAFVRICAGVALAMITAGVVWFVVLDKPELAVLDDGGPDVYVSLWRGAQPVLVRCGTGQTLSRMKAPFPPWDLTVRSTDNTLLLSAMTWPPDRRSLLIDNSGAHLVDESALHLHPPRRCIE